MNDIFFKIKEQKAKLDSYQPLSLDFVKNLNNWFKIELTYSSNAIEGNTLSRQETALVVDKGLTVDGKSIIEHLEAVNHAQAWDFILQIKDSLTIPTLSQKTILDIHSLILQKIDTSNAGRYRTVPVRIAGSTVIMPNYLKVPSLMDTFIQWLHEEKSDPIDMAIMAHFKLVSIHPFIDGNGRTARLLMNLILMLAGYPPAIIEKEKRRQYIESIEKGQLTGDLSDYYAVMYEGIHLSLQIYLSELDPLKDAEIDSPSLLKIGELAKLTEETVPTIRFWTNEGLLKVTDYSDGGYQLYSLSTIDVVKKIRLLQSEKRLTISEIKKFLR